jgi:limonene 1,2-monooxygenase
VPIFAFIYRVKAGENSEMTGVADLTTRTHEVHPSGLRCGIFVPPFCRRYADATLAIEREFDLVEHVDRIGFDEAWIGEHHSGGTELIVSPELFIAAAAVRTKRIRLGTGVISLPYHNPMMVADRVVQLDHQTRGRAMFGFGPGLLNSDAQMLGVPADKQRDRMVESLEVILRLLDGEIVTRKTEWFELCGARLQLSPYSRPRPHIAVASAVTPSGGKLAGRFGLGLLGVAAASAQGFGTLGTNWQIAEREAAAQGQTVRRSEYRMVAPFHIAETRAQAMAEIKVGFEEWADYTRKINPAGPISLGMESPEYINTTGNGTIGTPDDAVAAIEKFWERSGGFGCILYFGQTWASAEATKRSCTLFAEYVMPQFTRRNARRIASLDWMGENVQAFSAASKAAADKATAKFLAEPSAKAPRS